MGLASTKLLILFFWNVWNFLIYDHSPAKHSYIFTSYMSHSFWQQVYREKKKEDWMSEFQRGSHISFLYVYIQINQSLSTRIWKKSSNGCSISIIWQNDDCRHKKREPALDPCYCCCFKYQSTEPMQTGNYAKYSLVETTAATTTDPADRINSIANGPATTATTTFSTAFWTQKVRLTSEATTTTAIEARRPHDSFDGLMQATSHVQDQR